jgi:tetratricopeptide (TPR) repeat protein
MAVVLVIVSHAAIGLFVNLGNLFAIRGAMARPPAIAGWAVRATIIYQAASSIAPARTDLVRQIAEAFVYNQNWQRANAKYEEFRARRGDIRWAITRLRALAAYQGWCEAESERVRSAVERLSSKAEAFRVAGDICAANLNRDAAIRAYREAFGLLPNFEHARLLALQLLERAGEAGISSERAMPDYNEIIRLLEQARPAGRGAAQGYYALAVSYWRTNRFDEALAAYKSCLAVSEPVSMTCFTCALHLGYFYGMWLPQSRQDLGVATEYFRQAKTVAKNIGIRSFEVELALGQVWLRLERPEIALQHLEEAVRLQPGCLECRLSLGDAWLRLGRNGAARKQYEQVLRLSPANPGALKALEKLMER